MSVSICKIISLLFLPSVENFYVRAEAVGFRDRLVPFHPNGLDRALPRPRGLKTLAPGGSRLDRGPWDHMGMGRMFATVIGPRGQCVHPLWGPEASSDFLVCPFKCNNGGSDGLEMRWAFHAGRHLAYADPILNIWLPMPGGWHSSATNEREEQNPWPWP